MRRTDDRSQRLRIADDYTQATFVCPACRLLGHPAHKPCIYVAEFVDVAWLMLRGFP